MSMVKIDNRESAHVRSRVKDLSKVPNIVSYTGLFACITPLSKTEPKQNDEGRDVYEPILIRDVDSLIANFGDPRVDPVKYIDLYTVMKIVGNGTSCYVVKVDSGDQGIYELDFAGPTELELTAEQTQGSRTIFKLQLPDSFKISDSIWAEPTIIKLTKKEYKDPNGGTDKEWVPTELVLDTTGAKTNGYAKSGLDTNGILTITLNNQLDESVLGQPDDDKKASLTLVMQPSCNEKLKMMGYSSMDEELNITWWISQAKPLSIKAYYLNIAINKTDGSAVASARVRLEDSLSNQGLVNIINSSVGTFVQFELNDKSTAVACPANSMREHSIVYQLLEAYLPKDSKGTRTDITDLKTPAVEAITITPANFKVTLDNYIDAQKQLVDHKYAGCIMSDLTMPLTHSSFSLYKKDGSEWELKSLNVEEAKQLKELYLDGKLVSDNTQLDGDLSAILENIRGFKKLKLGTSLSESDEEFLSSLGLINESDTDTEDEIEEPADGTGDDTSTEDEIEDPADDISDDIEVTSVMLLSDTPADTVLLYKESFGVPTPEERRTIHYHLKEIARERKDVNVLLSTPLINNDTGIESIDRYDGVTPFTVDEICNWVSSSDAFNDQFQYGSTNTVDYGEQSFYLEMYFSWLRMSCSYIENGVTKAKMVELAPAGLVAQNVLTSYRERGIWLPVAGDQGGVLNEELEVIYNPKAKAVRDQLVSYRINPIWDTGTRGIQIYGNETLNAGYTDLNAAHIARALVNIRSRVDEYTETLKFSLNNPMLWDKWKNYVSMYILEPFRGVGALAKYEVAMGLDTTTVEEIANRMIKGKISLTFFQSAEIFDLEFTVYSSATAFD